MAPLLSSLQHESMIVHSLATLQKLPIAKVQDRYKHLYTGPIQFEEPILILVRPRTKQNPIEMLTASHWLRFKRNANSITAELHLCHASWPHTRWLIEMQLLGADGNVIASDTRTFENSGVAIGVPLVTRDKVSMHFQKPARAEAARYRLAINTIWASQSILLRTDHPIPLRPTLRVDREIPLDLTVSVPRMSAQCLTLDRRPSKKPAAKLHIFYEGFPATTWTFTLQLLNEQGKCISAAKQIFANDGVIWTWQSVSWEDLQLHFNSPVDLTKASRCKVTLERLAPKRYLNDSKGDAEKAG